MMELYIFCEGPTEQNFCQNVLQATFFPNHDGEILSIRSAHSRRRGTVNRGGVNKYSVIKNDIINTLRQHQRNNVFFTSMIDLYALPNDFPGKSNLQRNPDYPRCYVEALEGAFGSDIGDSRFIPHIQLHEYETLLFAEVEAFRISFDDCRNEIERLQAIVDSVRTIEHINDGRHTAPSKRIIDILPTYEGLKTSAGPDIAEYIGMDRLCERCPHFSDWITNIKRKLAETDENETQN